MPTSDLAQTAIREACAATLYGLDAVYRHDDPFDSTLLEIVAGAESLDGYDAASIDVFTGTGYRTLVGRAQSQDVLDRVHATVTRHPRRRFHTLGASAQPGSSEPGPAGWAGATLFSSNGAILGCLSLWSAAPIAHTAATHLLLPLLARATMQALEERRRVWNSRAVPTAGPRPVTTRRNA